MRWFTSDLHVGHLNIIPFCSRPFETTVIEHFALGDAEVTVPDVPGMNQALLDNYNDTVDPTDEVWFVGDVVMGTFKDNIEFMRRFHGNKFLVPGNHDRCHKMLPKWAKWQPFYEDVGFTVLNSQEIIELGGQSVKVCHFPYRGDSHHDDRFSGLRPDDEGDWLIHGHTHSSGQVDRAQRMLHVGVDAWDYRPVSDDQLISLMREEV
jgi:calcineurin-like phosphoesterase family protein